MRKIFSRIMIFLGCLLILASAALVAYNIYDSKRAEKASQEILDKYDEMKPELEEQTDDSGEPLYKEFPDMPMPGVEIDGYRYIAILEIPSIKLRLPVMEEWDYERLKISPCRFTGSAYTRDLVIAGHNYGAHFSQIKWIDPGTEVILYDMAGNEFHYKVDTSDTIDPDDLEGMIGKTDGSEWDMTMFTCTTGGTARCAVRCILDDSWQ